MRKFLQLKQWLLVLCMVLGASNLWGAEKTVTYVFTAYDWKATLNGVSANWTSGKAGSGFSNNGIQVTTTSSGANGTSPVSYSNITKVVATYNTNSSKGAGTIEVKIGDNNKTTKDWKYTSGTGTSANYTVQFDYTTAQSGNVKVTLNTTTNSIYLCKVAITYNEDDNKTTPTLTWSENNYTATIGGTNTFPTLTEDAESGTISYSSSQASVATIASDGTITLVAKGTTTITATAASTTTQNEVSASYTLTVKNPSVVIPTGDILDERFDTYSGTGGNDDTWSGISSGTTLSITNWTITQGYQANECVRFGTGSNKGSIQTPALSGLTKNAILMFNAAAWGNESATMSVAANDGTTVTLVSPQGAALGNSEWTTFTYHLIGGSATTKLTFSASQNRFFLDEVSIKSVTVDNPTFTPLSGQTSENPINVTINVPEGSTVYYTTDGSVPTASSTAYTSAITVSTLGTTTIKAIAVYTATGFISDVVSASYTIENNLPTPEITYSGEYSLYVNDTYDMSDATLTDGTSTSLLATADSYGTEITYTSSDNDIASIENGELCAWAAGDVTLTASIAATNEHNAAISKSITLHIVKRPVNLSVGASTTFEYNIGDTNADITVTMDADYDGTLSATSTDSDIADLVSNTIVVITDAIGSATVTITAPETEYYEAEELEVTINITDPNANDGTIDKPYTVTDVLNGDASGNAKYVTGYIVGSYSDNGLLTGTSMVNSNWAIAATDNASAKEYIIPVQIASANQSNWGVLTHKDLVGAKVLIKGNITSYFTKKTGVKNLSEIEAKQSVEISTAGYATLCSTNAMDFSNVTGITANTASVNGSTVTLTPVEQVPANAGVVLRGTAGTYYVPVTTETVDDLTNNELVGITEETTVNATADGKNNYILSNEDSGVGFYKASGAKLRAYRAYLSTSVTVSVKEFLGFAETDGIATVSTATENEGTWYNLAGQRIARPTHGLYIMNGRKVLVK